MSDPFAGDRVIWAFWLFTYNFYKNTKIFTDFQIWLIENVIKPTYQHEEKYLSMCSVTSEPRRHAENRNVCTLNDDGFIYMYTVYSDICHLSDSTGVKTLLTMSWRQNIFFGRALMTIRWYQPRILIHLHVKIWITSNTYSRLLRLTSNRQAKLRVTLRNLLARFSAKRNTDRKNKLPIDDRIHPTKKSLADIMAKYCVVFPQSAFEDPTAFHVCHVLLLVSILTSNAPGQCWWHQAIIWTNAGILLTEPLWK